MHFPQGTDLTAVTPLRPSPRHVGGDGHALRSVRVLASDGPSADESLPQMRPALPRQSPHPILHLSRPVSVHGIFATHLPREPARYRGVSASSSRQALSHGHPWRDVAQHARQRQSAPRLAHLRRVRADHDSHRSPLYADENLGLELDNTVYALDASTIDLCLSVFPWALFRSTKSAVKLHTLLDLRGNIPTFIHVSEGKMHDVNVLDILVPEPGAFYIMDRGYVDFERLFLLHSVGAFFIIRAKSKHALRAPVLPPGRQDDRGALRPDGGVDRREGSQALSAAAAAYQVLRCRNGKDVQFLDESLRGLGAHGCTALSSPVAGRTLLQVDQAALAHQVVLWHVGERGQDSDMDCGDGVRAGGGAEEVTGDLGRPLHNFAGFEPDAVRENAYF